VHKDNDAGGAVQPVTVASDVEASDDDVEASDEDAERHSPPTHEVYKPLVRQSASVEHSAKGDSLTAFPVEEQAPY